jgi:hypothetical protein
MILYTNGCSWTAGGGLEPYFTDPQTYVVDHDKRLSLLWPNHLGSLMGASKVYNLATGCGSNQRIVRKTYDWLLSKSKQELEQTIAVIQLTDWYRIELYDPKDRDNKWEDDPSDWVNCKINVICPDIEHYTRRRSNERQDTIFKESQDRMVKSHNLEDFYRTISYLYALKGMFTAFNVKDFYIWQHNHLWHEWPEKHRNVLFENFKVLDKSCSETYANHVPVTSSDGKDLFMWSKYDIVIDKDAYPSIEGVWAYDRISDKDAHPSIEGNKQIAKHIYECIKRFAKEINENKVSE